MPDFPPVYCLTIREQPYRRHLTDAHLLERGIQAKWVNGIYGPTSGLAPRLGHTFMANGKEEYMHPNLVACVLSHLFGLEMGLADGCDEFFVMEDDVCLEANFKLDWVTNRSLVPNTIDVVQCAIIASEDKPQEPINEFLAHCYYPFCSACNWWRRRGAELAVRNMKPINSPVDIMFMDRVFPFLGHAITTARLAWDHSGSGRTDQWPSIVNPR